MRDRNFWDAYTKATITGCMVGPVSATIVFPIDKIGFAYQTVRSSVKPTFSAVLRSAFVHPLSGYFPTVLNAASKNVILFPLKTGLENSLNRIDPTAKNNMQWAAFFAGVLTVYLTAPVSLFKAWRFNNVPVSTFMHAVLSKEPTMHEGKKIPPLNLRDMFRGVNTTALRDGIQTGIYFSMFQILLEWSQNAIFSGLVAGGVGSFCSNPASVVATNQKISYQNKNMFEMGKELYQEGGVKRFYRGFFTTTLGRMSLQGAAVGGVIEAAEKIHAHYHKKSNSI